MFKNSSHEHDNRRQYIRLDSVFPVQFRLLTLDEKEFLSDWQQGFTNNISKGGICLTVNNLKPELAALLINKQAKVSLVLEMPLATNTAKIKAAVAWVKDYPQNPDKYLVGLSYEEIDPRQNSKIMRYARAKKIFVPLVFSIILLLGAGFSLNSFINVKLIKGNKALVEQLVKILQESSIAKQKIKEISKEREDLQLKITTLETRINTISSDKLKLQEEKKKIEQAETPAKIKELTGLIDKLNQDKARLQEQMIALQNKESTVTEELLRLDKKKVNLEKVNLDKVYRWLVIHQNPRTGLVMSFEGDTEMANWAFIYDQSLVAQAYTHFSDFERAKKILDFFSKTAKRQGKWFYNAYYVNDGGVAEYTVHCGPNIWIGIAIAQYTYKAKDNQYLGLAEEIANVIIALQNKDSDAGIRGGPATSWYSTEHNLDAYAFFNMLYKLTQKDKYRVASEKILKWLSVHTYDKMDIPILRGKGDSTIATDTYAWTIAAVGPEKLQQLGMNPDKIMEFAQQQCAVEVNYLRPEGKTVKIKGFDFAAQRHIARSGVVSSEWTAQMVLSFKVMADFYYKKNMIAKARSYELKADEYLSQLGNLIISSPSPSGQGEGCLPYATQDFVDTGHGWMTPKGKSTGSVAGSAYTLFAYYKYNPLELKD